MNRDFDIEKVAQAIEADAGQEVPGIRDALAEVKALIANRVARPEHQALQPDPDIKP